MRDLSGRYTSVLCIHIVVISEVAWHKPHVIAHLLCRKIDMGDTLWFQDTA
jgi:hypothetical protein